MRHLFLLFFIIITGTTFAQQKISYIKMQRTACFGRCPEYTVEVFKNGKVTYFGKKNAKMQGMNTASTSAEGIARLFREIARYKLLSLNGNYKNKITDIPHLNLTFTINGKNKAILNAEGGPAYLAAIGLKIDSLVDNIYWDSNEPLPAFEVNVDHSGEAQVAFEEQPVYEGGGQAIRKFMAANLRYPEAMKASKTTGIVNVLFTVTTTGKVENIRIARGMGSLFNNEAMRVVALMTNWKPGRQNGKPVDMETNLEIEFKPE